MPYRGRAWDRRCLDQVANAPDHTVDLTPASEAPAESVREAWRPLDGIREGRRVPRWRADEKPCLDH